jgi:hypothetical protein
VRKQQKADDKVVQLVRTMVEVYSFVDDIESLPQRIERLESIVVEITRQTVECAIFICEYTGHGFSGMYTVAFFPLELLTSNQSG